jgi:hypothetical protein
VWLYPGGQGSLWLAECHSGPLEGSYHLVVAVAAAAVASAAGGGNEAFPHGCKHKIIIHKHNVYAKIYSFMIKFTMLNEQMKLQKGE